MARVRRPELRRAIRIARARIDALEARAAGGRLPAARAELADLELVEAVGDVIVSPWAGAVTALALTPGQPVTAGAEVVPGPRRKRLGHRGGGVHRAARAAEVAAGMTARVLLPAPDGRRPSVLEADVREVAARPAPAPDWLAGFGFPAPERGHLVRLSLRSAPDRRWPTASRAGSTSSPGVRRPSAFWRGAGAADAGARPPEEDRAARNGACGRRFSCSSTRPNAARSVWASCSRTMGAGASRGAAQRLRRRSRREQRGRSGRRRRALRPAGAGLAPGTGAVAPDPAARDPVLGIQSLPRAGRLRAGPLLPERSRERPPQRERGGVRQEVHGASC